MADYLSHRLGLANAPRPVWGSEDQAASISPELLIPEPQKKDIAPKLEEIDKRIREGVTRESVELLRKSGAFVNEKAVMDLVSAGKDAQTDPAIRQAVGEQLSKGDFQKLIADFIEIANTKDGDDVSKENSLLGLLKMAGGRMEEVSAENIRKVTGAQAGNDLRTSRVKIWGGNALVGSALGANFLLFVIDTAIAKSIIDYGLVSASSYMSSEARSGLSWFLSLLSQGYLLYGKSKPEILNPSTGWGKGHLTAFSAIGLGAVAMLSAKVIGSTEHAQVGVDVGEDFKGKLAAAEGDIAAFKKNAEGIEAKIEPLIKTKARDAAQEGKETTALDVARERLKKAQDALANANEKQRAERSRVVESAKRALDAEEKKAKQKEPVPAPAATEGADTPPNGAKSYTAWRVTYGKDYKVQGKTVEEWAASSGFKDEFRGFTVSKTEAGMAKIEKEFGLKPGGAMIDHLRALNAKLAAVNLSGLTKERQEIGALVEQLRPNEWRYILGPLYSVFEGDFRSIFSGTPDVEDLFARQPQFLGVGEALQADLKKIMIQQDMQRFQERVKEETGLDLGIQFPETSLSLNVEQWGVSRQKYAEILNRTTWYYLKRLDQRNLPTIAGVLTVFFIGLFLVAGAKRQRRVWREDSLSEYEAQEFAREKLVAEALVEDLAKREGSVYGKLSSVIESRPLVTVQDGKVTIGVASAPVPRSKERLSLALARGMRIAATNGLMKPQGMTDEEFTEMKAAFIERRPRKGVLGERSVRAHLGSEELARAYHDRLNDWMRALSGPDRAAAIRAIRSEITAFDGKPDHDSGLDRLEQGMQVKGITLGQIRDLHDAIDSPFRELERQALLAQIRNLASQRKALMENGAARDIVLDGTQALTSKDLLFTHALAEVDNDLSYYTELYVAVADRDTDLTEALKYDGESTKDGKSEFSKRVASLYAAERDNKWNGVELSGIVAAHELVLRSVGEKATASLAEKAREALEIPASSQTRVAFEFPYSENEQGVPGRILEINAYATDGREIASLPFPYRFPSATLDTDEKILKEIERFLSDDSIELQVARAEAKRDRYNAATNEMLEALPERIDVGSLSAEEVSAIDTLLLRADVLREQKIAVEEYLRKNLPLSSQQKILFTGAPETAQFSSFWRDGFERAVSKIADSNRGKTVIFRPTEEVFEIMNGEQVEKIVPLRS